MCKSSNSCQNKVLQGHPDGYLNQTWEKTRSFLSYSFLNDAVNEEINSFRKIAFKLNHKNEQEEAFYAEDR